MDIDTKTEFDIKLNWYVSRLVYIASKYYDMIKDNRINEIMKKVIYKDLRMFELHFAKDYLKKEFEFFYVLTYYELKHI